MTRKKIYFSIIRCKRSAKISSKSFDNTGNKCMGLYEDVSVLFLFGFGIGIICATFHTLEHYMVNIMPFEGSSAKSLAVMRS